MAMQPKHVDLLSVHMNREHFYRFRAEEGVSDCVYFIPEPGAADDLLAIVGTRVSMLDPYTIKRLPFQFFCPLLVEAELEFFVPRLDLVEIFAF